MKIIVNLDHNESLEIYQAAGFDYPEIPPGMNTYQHFFKTTDGNNAIILNQTGFSRTQSDNEEEVNGCSLFVILDAPNDNIARIFLERFADNMLSE